MSLKTLKFVADENFNNIIIGGLHRRIPTIDLVRVQDHGLFGADDLIILEWAASESRIILTHDVKTFSNFAFERMSNHLYMPGVFEIISSHPIKTIIDEIELIIECSDVDEWVGRVIHIPL